MFVRHDVGALAFVDQLDAAGSLLPVVVTHRLLVERHPRIEGRQCLGELGLGAGRPNRQKTVEPPPLPIVRAQGDVPRPAAEIADGGAGRHVLVEPVPGQRACIPTGRELGDLERRGEG